MTKCRHMLFGHRFIWVTDCYTTRFLLSYDSGNQAVQRLQMRIIGLDVDIVHWANNYLTDADYWSRLSIWYNGCTPYHSIQHIQRPGETTPPCPKPSMGKLHSL
jgi:hypothetical protein